MLRARLLSIPVLVPCFFLVITSQAFSDVSPGDVIDKTNWEKAQGLLPEKLLEMVKTGEFILEVQDTEYKPRACNPRFALDTMGPNAGRYDLNEDDWIVETASGKPAKGIIGFPFPEIAPDDPEAATKILYNHKYASYILGNVRNTFHTPFVDRSGYLRTQKAKFLQMVMDGNPKSVARPNPDGISKYQIALVASPYDIAGTAIMTWRYLDPQKEDNTFGYVPAIRRVRRMSPGNRSDALFGSDFSVDDTTCYDGKVTAMDWKLVGKREALLPFSECGKGRIVRNDEGEWETTEGVKEMFYGYQKEGWQGAPWAPVNWIWVKHPAYVIEMNAKDRYYNYGPQELWVDSEGFVPAYKVVNDKAGRYWKIIIQAHACFESADREMQLTTSGDQLAIDERSEHATIIRTITPTDIWAFFAEMEEDDFSLAGFQKFCK
jgi:hypothetical protein